MRVRVDRAKCTGHAQYLAVDSSLFPIDDGSSTLDPHQVQADDKKLTRQGVDVCPEQALVMEEDE